MKEFLTVFQVIVSILLILVILSQDRGTGLSATFGGGDGSLHRSKRGAEKVMATLTVILAIVFIGISFIFPFAT